MKKSSFLDAGPLSLNNAAPSNGMLRLTFSKGTAMPEPGKQPARRTLGTLQRAA